ncbi:hypothetical protein CWI38_0215p0050 [Hamiltosporidium tvaerminnensis]|uniref:Uncharacterized protein n=1 Tax=Hamiltosporidium tvaerminnensis TaxID=1176355 RepID=A0A4Q9M2G4_9MICR|nr:hypothetical protein CWI38_0215p0050 [Hamiltosporidium tvaerminnensis]
MGTINFTPILPQEILYIEYVRVIVDTRIKTDVKIRNNKPDIFILDKKKNKITFIEVAETEKLRKYDLLVHKLDIIYKCSVEIISYVIYRGGIVINTIKISRKT